MPSVDIESAPFFVLRTPLLPWDTWESFSAALEAPSAGTQGEALERAIAIDRARLRERLRQLVERADVREALFLASPSLDDSLSAWQNDPDSDRGLKVERTLVRYLSRMTGRSTPFGLFAGCSVGEIGGTTRLVLDGREHDRRHTRLDTDYLFRLVETLAQDRELQSQLRYVPNSSLYRAGGRFRYAEARATKDVRSYHLVAVDATEYLEAALAQARDGATMADLARALAEQAEVDVAEAEAFVRELVDAQVLVSELALTVTGEEPIHRLVGGLHGRSAASGALECAREELGAIDRAPIGESPSRYRALADSLRELPAELELSRLFQVDLARDSRDAFLGGEVLKEITAGVALLQRMAPHGEWPQLRRFREMFQERFEEAEVPLLEALDEDSGIGFGRSDAPAAEASPLLEGLVFPGRATEETTPWRRREMHLLRRLEAAARADAREIALDAKDRDVLTQKGAPPLPGSFAVMATVAAESEAAVSAGRFQLYLSGVSGPSGANLLGRFCHGDERLSAEVAAHLRREESLRPDAIFAEVVHLPEGRIGNVLLRPLLREYEIPYLGGSGAARDKQIPVDDLLLSVRGERIVLRSGRLGREIVPRLTTAHNHSHPRSLGVYRFLCALQSQGTASGLVWSWGPLESAAFLPRVVCGRIVLAKARWVILAERLKPLGEARDAHLFSLAQELRRELRLPRFVGVEDADNVLPVDFDNLLSIETFAQLVKQRTEARLVEMWPEPDALLARGPEGRFVHEIVVPFLRCGDAVKETPPSLSRRARRSFEPGSEWLYAKLYGGAASIDNVLRDVVAPLVRGAAASGAMDQWFFVRYGDPNWHLRVRFHGQAQRLFGELLPALQAAAGPLLADGRLWRVQLDTYQREVERYGGAEGVELAEHLFCADSEAVLTIVELLSDDEGADARWRLALYGMDRLLTDLGFDLPSKLELMRTIRKGFGEEFHVGGPFERQLGERFRRERTALEALLAATEADDGHPLALGIRALAVRSQRLAPVAEQLRASESAGRSGRSRGEFAASCLHMHANRLLRSAARAQELVIYDLLTRLYESRWARQRRSSSTELAADVA